MCGTHGQHFPLLWKTQLLLIAFSTSYLLEQAFGQALHMQTKYCNQFDLVSSGAPRPKLTPLSYSEKAGHGPPSPGLSLKASAFFLIQFNLLLISVYFCHSLASVNWSSTAWESIAFSIGQTPNVCCLSSSFCVFS